MIILFSVTLSKDFIKFVVDAKNNGPFTLYSALSCVTVTREILATKNSALKITPTTTPIAKFCVYKITATVTSMTSVSDRGACFINVRSEEHTSELQSRGQLVCRLLLEQKKQYK